VEQDPRVERQEAASSVRWVFTTVVVYCLLFFRHNVSSRETGNLYGHSEDVDTAVTDDGSRRRGRPQTIEGAPATARGAS